MDILLSALDSRVDATADPIDPGFADLVSRVTRRLNTLGTPAAPEQLDAVVLEVVQDVAQFTLAWADPQDRVIEPAIGMRTTDLQTAEVIHAERRW
jgi:hypothetical protein